MEKNITVSCIVITHNRVAYLKRAVESVLNQTYPDIELIVVDDASTDGTKEYGEELSKLGHKYIYISSSESRGGNYARNRGIKESSGEYIAFLDDDDYWLPEKTQKQVEYLNMHKDVGVVYSGWGIDFGHSILNYRRIPDKDYQGDIVAKQLYIAPFTSTITLMIRKELLLLTKGFDEKLKYWQEYELILRLIQICKVGLIEEVLAIANREKKVKRLTSKFCDWNSSVEYINEKHKALFEMLDEKNKTKKLEYYYKEAAYRAYASGNKDKMKDYYNKAYRVNPKIEYLIRGKLGISKNSTLILESMIMKLKYVKRMI